mgnify:CR=1 FL=1
MWLSSCTRRSRVTTEILGDSCEAASFSPRQGAKALSYCQPRRGGGVKVLLLLSHKKVTKRLWPAASYGKIGVVGYRLLQERDG